MLWHPVGMSTAEIRLPPLASAESDDTDGFDVVVVGSGAAGLCAALSARQAGARSVLLAEAEGVVGGSSRLSAAFMMGAGTRYQRAAGIEDTPDAMYRHYLTLNQWNVDVGPARRLCEDAGPTIEWLGDLGIEFHEQLIFGGDELVPRVHLPLGRGQAVVDVLARQCRAAGVEIALGRRVDRLLVEDGVVCGVAVGDDEIRARSVVITSGGFGNDPALLAEHFPSAVDTGWSYYIGADGSRGDHLALGAQAGALITGHDRGLRLLHANFDKMYESYIPGWLTMVDSSGRRFIDETAPYGILDGLVRVAGDRVWVIFDRPALEYSSKNARTKQVRPTSSNAPSPHWNVDMIEAMVAEGKVHEAATIGELAEKTGLPVDALEATVQKANRWHELGEDREFRKAPKFLDEIKTAPFYAAELRPASVCWTAYGLRVDRDAQVQTPAGLPVAGLWAAGECTSGVIGPMYVGSGNMYANCVTMGRVAGLAAAAHALQLA